MDEKSPDKLGFKGRMPIFTALEKTYGRDTAFDIASVSDDRSDDERLPACTAQHVEGQARRGDLSLTKADKKKPSLS
jgi:hypothetical protein